jgi:hypothetical protein
MNPILQRVLIGSNVVLLLIVVVELLPLLPRNSVQPRKIIWPPRPGRAILLMSQTNKGVLSTAAAALNVSTVTWEGMKQVITNHDEDLVWYCGSAANYDYFQLDAGPLSRSRSGVYRILDTNSPLTVRFPLCANGSNWISWAQAAGLTHGIAWR